MPAPNEVGVSMAQLYLHVKDVDSSKAFWITLGGMPTKLGAMDVVKFSGLMIILQQGDPSGGTVGSTVNHFGFVVPNVQAILAKLMTAGLKTQAGSRPQQGYVFTPDDLTRVEFAEDPTQSVPIAAQHIHFWVAPIGPNPGTPEDMQAWYLKVFGAKPGTFLSVTGAATPGGSDLPGIQLRFAKTDMATVATRGRMLDHIGFEVKNLEAFCKKAEANGVKFDPAYTKRSKLGISEAYTVDPWGTSIELTEGMGRL